MTTSLQAINARIFLKLFLLILCIFILPIDALADTFRCPNGNIVSTGDAVGLVAAKCGRPASKSKAGASRTASRKSSDWTYNMGPRDFIYILKFRNGKLASIENTGQYGN